MSKLPLTLRTAAALCAIAAVAAGQAATPLADQPLFSNTAVPGNLALALSVEWPTASRTAHTAAYTSATEFLGYFDPNKCYTYTYNATNNAESYFAPAGLASGTNGSGRQCTGDGDGKWSGNFLNWASTATIDPFRWAMTGGYRVVDQVGNTILQKAWHSGQGLFGNRDLPAAQIAGATPFTGSKLTIRINGLGFRMRVAATAGARFSGAYYNGKNTFTGTPVLTRANEAINFNWGTASPGTGVWADSFSVRWTGSFVAPVSGSYGFASNVDDGARIVVTDTATNLPVTVVDRLTDSGLRWDEGYVTLVAGRTYNLRMDYYDSANSAQAELHWRPPGADWALMSDATLNGIPYDGGNTLPAYVAVDMTMRVKVCDPAPATGGVEANCKRYSDTNWKPEGLMQQYSSKIRFSAFGYLNDDTGTRDGGVLRAKQKFVGPTQPVPGQADVTNAAAEWSATTGIFNVDPDTADSIQSGTDYGVSITNSGVINYLNKFGQIPPPGQTTPGNYKGLDPVSELYYAVMRYYRNVGPVPTYSSMTGASTANKNKWMDNFPVITRWDDPIQYSCQKNFILGIGDIYTHRDKNLPGSQGTTNEPARPQAVLDDPVDLRLQTNRVGALQGLGDIGNGDDYSGRNNSAFIAGAAWWANTSDIRPDDNRVQTIGKQHVKTYWVDVLEQAFVRNNQFYLAAKYGGFAVPTNFDPASSALTDAMWWTTGDYVVTSTNPLDRRPDNYFTGGNPRSLVTGLQNAFSKIDREASAFTSSLASASPNLASTGNASYSSNYQASTWTSELTATSVDYDTDGSMKETPQWTFSSKLGAQAAGTGWSATAAGTGRRIFTSAEDGVTGVPFRWASLSDARKAALDTTALGGADGATFLDYLRGDRSRENISGEKKVDKYRYRAVLLGDISGSKVVPVGPPAALLADATNPGYAAFKTTWRNRPTVVYVGTNGGMLHAIDGTLTGASAGKELFAYVPGDLFLGPNGTPQVNGLAALGSPDYTHRQYVNASPVVTDINLRQTQGAAADLANPWRSVLIGGLGKGGRSYYALDVTDPAGMAAAAESTVAGKLMWEFRHEQMGYSYGDPVVVKTRTHGWVVILTSGYNNADGQGWFFIVNPRTGALIQAIPTGAGSVAQPAGLAHASAFIADATEGTADAVYAGDLLGNLWRLDLTTTGGVYPAPIKLAELKNAVGGGQVQSVTSRPLIDIEPGSNRRWVMVGTGQLLANGDVATTTVQSFYAIRDGYRAKPSKAADLPSGVTFPFARTRNNFAENTNNGSTITLSGTQVGWVLDLGQGVTGNVGWRVVSPATAYSGNVYFAANLPSGDACNPSGKSRIYVLDYGSGRSAFETLEGGVVTTQPYLEVDGTVTDLVVRHVAGKPANGDTAATGDQVRGKFATDSGTTDDVPVRGRAAPGVVRINWREVPTLD